MFSKRNITLPLFRHPPLTVLTFIQNDKDAHVIFPLVSKAICDLTPDL